MREIKFRIYFEDEEPFMANPISIEDLLHEDWIEFENEDNTVSLPLKDFRFFYEKNKNYKIMQYTGLKDKNEKEIYEGDIISNGYEKCIVVWVKEYAGFMLKLINKEYKDKEWTNPIIDLRKDDEVIGNIYKNPELLEDK